MEGSLRKTVIELAHEIGPRSYRQPGALRKASEYIRERFEEQGYAVSSQAFRVGEQTYENLSAEISGVSDKTIIVGAHYDSVSGTPGADDNASGVAAVLELSGLLRHAIVDNTVRFVAFTLEEPPFFRTEHMGSHVYARGLRERGENVIGMICLEMIGFFTDKPRSQYFPVSFMRWFYPRSGNFISMVSDLRSKRFLSRVLKGFRKGTSLPVEHVSTLPIVPGIDFSDHRSFWEFGYDALMITDTSFYRNPNYHGQSDTYDTLDYVKMAEVVRGIEAAIREIAVVN